MKIILSENQIKRLSEDFSEFHIAPYSTPEEYFQKDPEGYRRSEKLGTLDLYYPDREKIRLTKKIGRPKGTKNLSMSNIVTDPIIPPKKYKERKNKFWTPDKLEQEALKYNSRGEFFKKNAPAYVIALRIPDFMDKIYGQKKSTGDRIWTPEAVEKEGRKYNSRSEFNTGNTSAYNKALKIPGLMEKLFPFKTSRHHPDKLSTNAGEVILGSWISTKTEDFKVVSLGKNKIIGKSFCRPDKTIEINPDDVVDINDSKHEKYNDLKMDFTQYYQEAGLTEDKIRKDRERYKGGSNIIMFLDDSRNPFTSKEDWIRKYTQIGTEDIHTVRIPNFTEFVNHIQNYGLPKQIIFDHDLAKNDDDKSNTGCKAASWLVKYCISNNRSLPKWSIISANKYGRCCIGNVLRKYEELINKKSEME